MLDQQEEQGQHLVVLVLLRKLLLEESHQLLGGLGDVEGTLDHLLGHKVLVEGLSLGPEDGGGSVEG